MFRMSAFSVNTG